tara:strand:- start:1688 stop:1915 length:228 start_codon:yes stop_codon:yes gene_type:complete
MSDIGKIGHVVRIEKNTLDLLGEIKKSAGIPKYKTIGMAVQYFYDNNEELETLIELKTKTTKAMKSLKEKIKDDS